MYLPFAMCGAAVSLAAGGYHYAALWPESQLFGTTLVTGSDSAEIALTFDDGPNDPYTWQLLEVLERFHVHATFFMIGDFVRRQPELARAVRKAGHVIGSHTMTHPRLMYSSSRRIREEIQGAHTLIEDTLGERVHFFRPPFGARRPEVLRVVRELHVTPVMWNVTGFDWNAKSARAIEVHIERGIVHNQNRGTGTSVLLHDGSHTGLGADRRRTVSAVATLLNMIPRTGMHLVTVDQWLPAEEAPGPRSLAGIPAPEITARAGPGLRADEPFQH